MMKTITALVFLLLSPGLLAMVEMGDEQLSQVTGQALMQMGKTPGEGVSGDVTFYKAGLDVEMEVNMNIDKLQLGCTAGNINGQYCDIDIDHFSLSGKSWSTARPESSALLTRHFFEFAVRNDDSKTLREVVGIRMSAENTSGILTMGENGPTPNGINSLSGYMVTNPIYGTAHTQATNLGCARTNPAANCEGGIADSNATVLQFDTAPNIALCTSGCGDINTSTSVPGQSRGVLIPSMEVQFNGPGAVINGRRETSTNVIATGNVPQVSLDGGQLYVTLEETISVTGLINVSNATVNLEGSVSGLVTEIDFTQDLGLIHKIDVDSPFSLSFQKDLVKWPGSQALDVAQEGWWMSFSDPVDLGELNPVELIDIGPAKDQMAEAFRRYFSGQDQYNNNNCPNGLCQPPPDGVMDGNPIVISTGQGLQQLFNGEMTVDTGPLYIPTTLFLSISNLQLGASQDVAPNCWGAASFC